MTSLLARLAAYFVEPADEAPAPRHPDAAARPHPSPPPNAAAPPPAPASLASPATAGSFAPPSDRGASPAAPGSFAPPSDATVPPAAPRAFAPPSDRGASPATAGSFAPPSDRAASPAAPGSSAPPSDRGASPAAPGSFAPPSDATVPPTAPGSFAPPADATVPPTAPGSFAPPAEAARSAPPTDELDVPGRDRFAVVLGAPATVVPVAAACAGELRARERAAAAVLCVWRPGAEATDGEQAPAGATTPAARRLAGRLAAHGLAATACGRLAWVSPGYDPDDAAAAAVRCRAVADGPVVLAVAGPRPPAVEPLLAEADLAIAVLRADADDALRELALATLPPRASIALPPLSPGPPRWAAMAGLARLRSLPAEVTR